MADTDIEIRDADLAKMPPKALVGEIERTRADLARTIDAIADRVAPANVARRAADRAKERVSQVDPLIAGAAALAAVSVTCYLVWRKLRS
jgi:anti-sigma factor RsiW